MQTKPGIHFSKAKGLLFESGATPKWSIVVGSGIASSIRKYDRPILPTWKTLIFKLYKDLFKTDNLKDIESFVLNISLDGALQSIKNYSNLDDKEFGKLISEALYKDLWNELHPFERDNFFKILSNPVPGGFQDIVWESFFRTLNDYFSNYTFFIVAKTIIHNYKNETYPDSIISFNAEPLLFSTLTCLLRQHWARKQRNHPNKNKQWFDINTRSISYHNDGRIPFYYIHGHLPIPFINREIKKSIHSIDKLVFSETEYLNLANSAFSWQSSLFLHHSYSNILIFIGLSFSDSNLRKWLSWTNNNRISEIKQITQENEIIKNPTKHYWIKKSPSSENEIKLIENSVSHLGVRLIWIDDYTEIGEALNNLIAL